MLKPLTIYQLRSSAAEHRQAVLNTPGIDHFCSSLDWILPAHEAFIPDHPLYLRTHEGGYVCMARGFHPNVGRYLQPLEASWCLASPFVGADVDVLVSSFFAEQRATQDSWDLILLAGVQVGSTLFQAVLREAMRGYNVSLGHVTRRYRAQLGAHIDAFLARRSARFQRNLRRTLRVATREGVTVDVVRSCDEAGCDLLYERILDVERKSWKGREGTGIVSGEMRLFYRLMIPRLARRHGLRVLFLQRDKRDVAYVLGGVLDGVYRGLQLSFDDAYRHLGLGNLAQYYMIHELIEEGVSTYDLGSELAYKQKWCDEVFETVSLSIWQ